MSAQVAPAALVSRRAAFACASAATLLGLLGAAGWATPWRSLASLHSSSIPMAPSSALALLLLGGTLMADARRPSPRWAMSVSLLVLALALSHLVLFVEGLPPLFDTLLVPQPEMFGVVQAGRMSPWTALGLVLASISLLLASLSLLLIRLAHRRPALGMVGGLLAFGALVLGGVVTLGYLFRAPLLYGSPIVPMALPTALAVALLGLALLGLGPRDSTPLRPFLGGSARARLLRASLPLAPAILVGEFLFQSVVHSNPAMRAALTALLSAVVATLIVSYVAHGVGAELERAQAESMRSRHDADRLAAIVRSSSDAIYAKDLAGTVLAWNASAERLFGHSAAFALGRPATALGLPDAQHEASGEWIQSGAHALRRDATFLRPDGSRAIVSVSESLIRDPDGSVAGVSVIARDVSEQQAAEAALRRSEEELRSSQSLLRMAGRLSRVGAWSVELPDQRLTLSDEARMLQDVPPEAVLTVEEATALYEPGSRATMTRAFDDCVRDGTPFDVELRVLTLGGRRIWVRSMGEAERDAAGTILRVQGAIQDISERKRVQAALEGSEARYRSMLQGVEAGVIVHGADSRIVAYNHKATELLGVDDARMIAREPESALWGRVHVDGSTFLESELPFRRAQATRRPVHNVILGVDRTAQARLWLLVSANPVLTAHGDVDEVIVTFMDVTAQIAAEQAVRDAGAFATAVLNSLAAHVVVLDERGTILAVNETWREFARQNGGGDADFLGANYLLECEKPIRRADAAGARNAAAGIRAVLGGERSAFSMEYPCDSPDEARWFRMNVAPLSGGRRGVVISHHDLTARRRAETALLESEAKFRTLTEAMPQLVWIAVADGSMVYCNQQWIDYTGLTREESLGQGWTGPFHPDDRRRAQDSWQHALATDTTYAVECRLRRSDGVYRWWLIRAVAMHDAGNRAPQWFGTCTDIHDLKLAEIEISNSEQRFARIFQSNLVAIGIAEIASGRLVDVNLRHAEFFGYAREEMLGRTVFELGLWADPAERARHIAGLSAAGPPGRLEARFRRKSGEIRHALVSMETITLPGIDQPLNMVALVDITERRQLEAQLRQAQKMDAVGRLAGGIAHDFNNALGVILGYTELLLRQAGDGQRGKLEQILKATQHAAGLTRQLLAFSRKQIVDLRVLDLNAVLSELERMLGRLIGEDIDLAIVSGPDLGKVKADAGQLEQVMLNLCANARDAMPDGGLLRIETMNSEVGTDLPSEQGPMTPGRYVTITVSDNGHGMERDVLAKIFEPFFTTKEPGKGTGLGLATAYGIVKQAGGYIWATSEPARGTTFRIFLPRVDEPMSPPIGHDDRPPERGSETILVVEDETSLRAIAREILSEQGYRVLEAGSAAEAIALASGDSAVIHLLLTDVVMPGGNGRQLAESLRTSRPAMRVLYMSGYTDDVIARRGVLEPGTLLLEKPFTAQALLGRVRATLASEGEGGAS